MLTVDRAHLYPWAAGLLFNLLVVLAILLPRAPALDRFVTVDEWDWFGFSASFYRALYQRDFSAVYQTRRLLGLLQDLIGFFLVAYDPFHIGLPCLHHPGWNGGCPGFQKWKLIDNPSPWISVIIQQLNFRIYYGKFPRSNP